MAGHRMPKTINLWTGRNIHETGQPFIHHLFMYNPYVFILLPLVNADEGNIDDDGKPIPQQIWVGEPNGGELFPLLYSLHTERQFGQFFVPLVTDARRQERVYKLWLPVTQALLDSFNTHWMYFGEDDKRELSAFLMSMKDGSKRKVPTK